MNQDFVKKISTVVLVAVAFFSIGTHKAEAGSLWYHFWCGSSGGSHGSHGGLLYHIFHPHHHSWGGSHGSWGSHGGSSGSWKAQGGLSFSSKYSAEQFATKPNTQKNTPAHDPASTTITSNDILLEIDVPEEAKVFVNGKATTTLGSHRQFISHGTQPDRRYSYKIRAEVVRDGKIVRQEKTVTATGGESANISFELEPIEVVKAQPVEQPNLGVSQIETSLILHVPDDAQVTLEGKKMKEFGSVRLFRTKSIPVGKRWSNYSVQVAIERNGRTITRSKQIDLQAGDRQELKFDFDPVRLVKTQGRKVP